MANRVVVALLFVLPLKVWAAACCGGSTSLPTLITGDNQAQFNASYSNAATIYDVNTQSTFSLRDANSQEVQEQLSLQAAYLLSPLWQLGAGFDYVYNTKRNLALDESSHQLGDSFVQAVYEFLPELSYSQWKPRGFVYSKLTLPTGTYTYEAHSPLKTDASGSGFYALSTGVVFQKIKGVWDFLWTSDLNYKAPHDYKIQSQEREVQPGLTYSHLLSVGYSPLQSALRLGASLSQTDREKTLIAGLNADSQNSYHSQLGFSASYVLDNYSFTAFYNDQTLMPAKNTSLTKTIGLSLIHFLPL